MSNKYYELRWRENITKIQDLHDLEMKPLQEIVGKGRLRRDRTSKEFFKFYGQLFIGQFPMSIFKLDLVLALDIIWQIGE